jgi:hypothetical protein
MKGILVHSTTMENLESILSDGALYDSSKTEGEFDKGEVYKEILDNKIFFQLVFEPITITGNYKIDKGFYNECILLFDSSMIEEYGNKKYIKNEEQENKLKRYSDKMREFYLDNNIPKTKVWFNVNWGHGGFHKLRPKKEEFSFNYNPKLALKDNIQEFYDAKLREIKRTAEENYEENLELYQEVLEDEEYEMTEEEKNSWNETLSSEFPKTFTHHKVKNEVVFQAKRISLKETKKSSHLLAVYCYYTSKKHKEKLEKEYPEYTFLKTPEELQEFMEMYYA